jgi:NADPH:quinone reductase-like Zn-dependent oxidoreductase
MIRDTSLRAPLETDVKTPATMMAWRVHSFGSPSVMQFEEVARPAPGPGEVLVRVHAAGVGPWDGWIRGGKSAVPQPLPLILGSDLAGDVVALGTGVSGLSIGDQIYGVTNSQFTGAYAEYALASASMIGLKPTSLTYVEAASAPVVAVTAWQALFDKARLKENDTVLIHGAAGSVGSFAVQLAHRQRIRVVATAAEADVGYVRGLGADTVLNYQTTRFEGVVKGADAVIDLVGGESQTRSFDVLRPGGRLISLVSKPDPTLAQRYGVEAEFFLVKVTRGYLSQIAHLLESGEVKVQVGAVIPLADARDAHRMLDGTMPRPRGKIVLTVDH